MQKSYFKIARMLMVLKRIALNLVKNISMVQMLFSCLKLTDYFSFRG